MNENFTNSSTSRPQGAHLVGSVPLANSEEVFRTASSILGDRLYRIPDGETGARTNWIGWQVAFFEKNPAFELIPPEPEAYTMLPSFKLRPDAPGKLIFDN